MWPTPLSLGSSWLVYQLPVCCKAVLLMQKIEINKLVEIIFKTMKFKLPQVPTVKLPQFISTLDRGRLFLSYSDRKNFDTTT